MRLLLSTYRRSALTAYSRACQTVGRHTIHVRTLSTAPSDWESTTSTEEWELSVDHDRVVYKPPPRNIHWNTHAEVSGPFGTYKEEYELSLRNPEAFWKKAAEQIEWFQRPSTILDYDVEKNPYFPKWFPDGVTNMSYNCLDVHVKNGRGKQDALIYDSPVTGTKQRFTYEELLHEVSMLAGAMKDLGVEPGDRVGK